MFFFINLINKLKSSQEKPLNTNFFEEITIFPNYNYKIMFAFDQCSDDFTHFACFRYFSKFHYKLKVFLVASLFVCFRLQF